ncbi:MAG TPA: hypothetical protein VLB74_08825 [Flavobacterium sp.]|uniref:hypothetical protein n=1 Tax=Flavobacterium sp. TaxID=239 RepID=UPI002BFA8FBD|nr:hypothetical protein [Flavobacterium sp.]HSD14738.1 hypothetical protein [Flavobacterium sp.]
MKIIPVFLFFVYSYSYSQAPAINWMIRYGGSQWNYGNSLIPTLEGGFMLGGYSNSNASGIKTENLIGFDDDYWILKLNNAGSTEAMSYQASHNLPYPEIKRKLILEALQMTGLYALTKTAIYCGKNPLAAAERMAFFRQLHFPSKVSF